MSPSAHRISLLTVAAVASATASLTGQTARAVDVVTSNNSLEAQFNSGANPTQYKTSQAQVGTGMRIGYQSQYWQTANDPAGVSTNGGMNAILYFQLPAIPAGQQLNSAALNFSLLATATGAEPIFNVDLYAIGYDKNAQPLTDGADLDGNYNKGGVTSTRVAPAYFYMPTANTDVQTGPSKVANADGTISTDPSLPISRIQDNLLSSTPDGTGKTQWDYAKAATDLQLPVSTSATGNSALVSYLQSLYADPNFTPGHDYLILRMNPDQKAASSSTMRYQIPYAQTDTTSGATSTDATPPTLSLTFALSGDTNLDGKINGDDYALIDRGFARYAAGSIPANGAIWSDGDFNHDGQVTSADYLIIDQAFLNSGPAPDGLLAERQAQFGSAYVQELLSSVPEPTSLSLLALTAPPLLTRRRPRRA